MTLEETKAWLIRQMKNAIQDDENREIKLSVQSIAQIHIAISLGELVDAVLVDAVQALAKKDADQ